jgi:hypothetical protein
VLVDKDRIEVDNVNKNIEGTVLDVDDLAVDVLDIDDDSRSNEFFGSDGSIKEYISP